MRYWSNQGKHQKVYQRLHDKLVPDYGEADTEAGEIIRVIGNVVYDVGNNGGCNFNDGRRGDLDQFIAFLKQFHFAEAGDLGEQLFGLAETMPDRHCETCDCQDDYKQYPPLNSQLFDKAIDLLVVEANRLDKRKKKAA